MNGATTLPCGCTTNERGQLTKPCKDAAGPFIAAANAARRVFTLSLAECAQMKVDLSWIETHLRQGRGRLAARERAAEKAAERKAARR